MTKTYCDKCKKGIKETDEKVYCDIGHHIFDGNRSYYVLCEECGSEILNILNKKTKE